MAIDVTALGTRRVLPGEGYAPARASSSSFGGALAGASGAVSAALALSDRIAANEKQLQLFNYESQFIQLQDADNTAYEERKRSSLSGDGAGWWQGAREQTGARVNEWLSGLPEAERAQYQVKADRFLAGRTAQAFNDQYAQQDANTRATIGEAQRVASLQVQSNPALYDQFVKQQVELIGASTLSAEAKAKEQLAAVNALAYTAEMARARTAPDTVAVAEPPSFRPDVNAAIDRAAKEAGVDPATLRRVAKIESSGDPTAVNGSYSGLFQMSAEEFAKYGGGKILDPYDNAKAAARKLRAEASAFRSRTGRAPDEADLYLQHQQGVAGYAAHLSNPDAPAWENMAGTAEGRAKGPEWAKAAIWGNLSEGDKARFPGGVETVTSAAFTNAWRKKFAQGEPTAATGALTAEQAAVVQETARRQRDRQAAEEQRVAVADRARKLNDLFVQLKEGDAPDNAYTAARASGLLSDFNDIAQADNILKARGKKDEDYRAGLALMAGGSANPFEKDHRDGLQAFYAASVSAGEDPATVAEAVFNRTGVVAPGFAKSIRAAMASGNEGATEKGMTAASNMLRGNPNAFAGVDGGAEMEKAAVEFMRLQDQLDLTPAQAAARIVADARTVKPLDPVKQDQVAAFKNEHLTQTAIDKRVAGMFTSWSPFNSLPRSVQLPAGPQRDAMASVYAAFATEGLENTRDPDKALAYADHKMSQQFGVHNGYVVRFPPSKAGFPRVDSGSGAGYGWISEQAAEVVKAQLGVDVDPGNIVLAPVERGATSTKRAFTQRGATVSRADGSALTSVPYMITVMPSDPEQPILVVPGAFYPDVTEYTASHAGALTEAQASAAATAERERALAASIGQTREQRAYVKGSNRRMFGMGEAEVPTGPGAALSAPIERALTDAENGSVLSLKIGG